MVVAKLYSENFHTRFQIFSQLACAIYLHQTLEKGFTFMQTFKILKFEKEDNYEQNCFPTDNRGQNVWKKVNDSSKTEQD